VTEQDAEPDWARAARAGSAGAFGRLVHRHQQGLRAFLRRLTANSADADDLAQETFVFAWEHIARFDPTRSFRPWVFGIAWRKYREGKRGWLRRLTRQGRAAEDTQTVFQPDPGLKLDLESRSHPAAGPEGGFAALPGLRIHPCRGRRGLGLAAGYGKIPCGAGARKTGRRAWRCQ
jgi:hypothetical protein